MARSITAIARAGTLSFVLGAGRALADEGEIVACYVNTTCEKQSECTEFQDNEGPQFQFMRVLGDDAHSLYFIEGDRVFELSAIDTGLLGTLVWKTPSGLYSMVFYNPAYSEVSRSFVATRQNFPWEALAPIGYSSVTFFGYCSDRLKK